MFKPGNKHGKGRPKGSTNKTSKQIREVSAMLLSKEMGKLQKKLPKLNDADYLKALSMLYKYVIPTQKQIEVDDVSEIKGLQIEVIERLDEFTDEELRIAVDKQKEIDRERVKNIPNGQAN